MPKDDISKPRKAPAPTLAIDDADDEVIDLLEVVKPGRKVKQDADNDDRDFGADLDAMLDGLSEAGENSSSPHISDEPAPFPDPTPVDHKVDHNETLDLPGMDDLDGLLKSLGDSGANDEGGSTPGLSVRSVEPDAEDVFRTVFIVSKEKIFILRFKAVSGIHDIFTVGNTLGVFIDADINFGIKVQFG